MFNTPLCLLGCYVGFNQDKIATPVKKEKRSDNESPVPALDALKPNTVKGLALLPYMVMILQVWGIVYQITYL